MRQPELLVRPPHALRADDIVYFLHIPKTGGCTLTDLIRHQFEPRAVKALALWREVAAMPREELEAIRLFSGHFGYKLPALIRRPMIFLTLLREPVRRVVSLFGHIQRVETHPLREYVLSRNMTLTDFVHDPLGVTFIRDQQVYHLAHFEKAWMHGPAGPLPPEERRRVKLLLDAEFAAEPADELVEIACRRLDRMAVVGVTERMDEVAELVGWTLGFDDLPAPGRHNAAPAPWRLDDVPPATLDRIRELTRLDARVYAHAHAVLQRKLEQMQRYRRAGLFARAGRALGRVLARAS
jgi:hypothetical protein